MESDHFLKTINYFTTNIKHFLRRNFDYDTKRSIGICKKE